MDIRAGEISKIIKEQLGGYSLDIDTAEVGTVVSVGDGIAQIHGVDGAMATEMLEFPHGVFGIALNLEENNVGVVLLGKTTEIKEGDTVRRTGRIISVPVGDGLLGRVVNALGQPIDGKGPIATRQHAPIERIAPGVVDRQPVKEPLQTGLKAIDAMIPIGRGQRELIIGDRQTGKTAVAVDTIINQKGLDVICIYNAIGQKQSTVAQVVRTLEENGAMEHTTSWRPPPPIRPRSCTSARTPRARWVSTSVTVDATQCAFTTISPSTRRPIARSRCYCAVRRGARRTPAMCSTSTHGFWRGLRSCGRSSVAGRSRHCPIIETQAGDLSAYIPTNVISITDGQIFLESDLFHQGIRPAINVGNSVSRVGGSAQVRAMRQVAGTLRLDLAQFRELAAFAQFGSDLDKATQDQLNRGRRLVEVLKQPQYQPLAIERQVLIIFAGNNGYLDAVAEDDVTVYEQELYQFIEVRHGELLKRLTELKKLDDQLKVDVTSAVMEFTEQFTAARKGAAA